MKNSLFFTILGASLISVAALPVFVIAKGVQATPPGGDVAETLVNQVGSKRKSKQQGKKSVVAPKTLVESARVDASSQSATSPQKPEVEVDPNDDLNVHNNIKIAVGGTMSDEQLLKLCAAMGQSIKDAINPPKEPTFWDSRLGRMLWYPCVALGHLPAEMRMAASLYLIIKYKPEMLEFFIKEIAKMLPGLGQAAFNGATGALADMAKTATEYVVTQLPPVNATGFYESAAAFLNGWL
jgi:hypothetical protein